MASRHKVAHLVTTDAVIVMSSFVASVKGWCALRWPAPPPPLHRSLGISGLSPSRPEWTHCVAAVLQPATHTCQALSLMPWVLRHSRDAQSHTHTTLKPPPHTYKHTYLKPVGYEQINTWLRGPDVKAQMCIRQNIHNWISRKRSACARVHTRQRTRIHTHTQSWVHKKHTSQRSLMPVHACIGWAGQRGSSSSVVGAGEAKGNERLTGAHTLAHGNGIRE